MHVSALSLAKQLYKEWKTDETSRHAAAIAYYTVFSLPAFILIIISIAGATLDKETVNDEVFDTMRMYIGDRTVVLLEEALNNIDQLNGDLSWIGIFGFIVLVMAATGIIRELQSSMNRIIGIKPVHHTLQNRIWTYVFSLILLLVTAAILVASIISGTFIGVMSQKAFSLFSIPVDVLSLVHNIVTYSTLTILIFFSYLFLPEKRFPVLISFLSAVIASSLLVIGTVAASYYISHTSLGKAYGVASNVLILLFWIYFAGNVFLFGAEIMEVAERIHIENVHPRYRWIKRLLHLK